MEGAFSGSSGDFAGRQTLLQLSADLKSIYEEQINHDLMLCVGNRLINCHRAILRVRSRWFNSRINKLVADGEHAIMLDENEKILDALLVYIYTGNLRLIESLNVPLLELWLAAAQYGLDRFKNLLGRMMKSDVYAKLKRARPFLWKVKINDCNSGICTFIFGGFSLNVVDKWSLRIMSHDFRRIKNGFCVYVTREARTENHQNIIHMVNLEMHILDSSGKRRKSFVNDNIFTGDGSIRMLENKCIFQLEDYPGELIPGGILTFSGKLTVTAEDINSPQRMLFQIKGDHEKAVASELHALSYDMHKLLRASTDTDMEVCSEGSSTFSVKVHSYILFARSLIPDNMLMYFIGHCCSGSIVARSFVQYLYTGQPRYLEGHIIEIYMSICELGLPSAKGKYSRILANNLTDLTVFRIVYEAAKWGDYELVSSGLSYIANNDLIDQEMWSKLEIDTPRWRKEISRARLISSRHLKNNEV